MNGLNGISFFDMPAETRDSFYKGFNRELDKFICELATLLVEHVDEKTEVGEHVERLKRWASRGNGKKKRQSIPVFARSLDGGSCSCRNTPGVLDTGRSLEVLIGEDQAFAFPINLQIVLEAFNFVGYFQENLESRRDDLHNRIRNIEDHTSDDHTSLCMDLPWECDLDELAELSTLNDLMGRYERFNKDMDEVEAEIERLEAEHGLNC